MLLSTKDKPRFRQWYERQLFESFAWLGLCLLAGVFFGVVLEFFGLGDTAIRMLVSAFVLYVIGLLGINAFRKFWMTLTFAQNCANAATCSQCGSYGLFDVKLRDGRIPAHCSKCGNQWVIGESTPG